MLNLLFRKFSRADDTKGAEVLRAHHEVQANGRKSKDFIEYALKVPQSKLGDYRDYLSVGSGKVWATFRACDLTASFAGSTIFKVHDIKSGGEIKNPDLDRLLIAPNPYDSWEEQYYQWFFHMILCGNAYWLKDEIDSAGRPTSLYPLLPQYVKILPDPVTKVKKFIYEINGKAIAYDPEEIIHFRRPHPSDLTFGIGDIEAAKPMYENFINRHAIEEKFLENGAMPSGILSRGDEKADDVAPAEFGRIKKLFETQYTGRKNAGKVMFLAGPWKYERLGLTHQEMQSIEMEKFNTEQIFLNHGVPLSVAGLRDAANYATAKQDEINFRKYRIVPFINLFVGKLNGSGTKERKPALVKAFNEGWELTYEMSGLMDVQQVWMDYGQAFLSGIMTANELRERMGLPKEDNPLLDQYTVPQGRVPIEMMGAAGDNPNNPAADDLKKQAAEFERMMKEAGRK